MLLSSYTIGILPRLREFFARFTRLDEQLTSLSVCRNLGINLLDFSSGWPVAY